MAHKNTTAVARIVEQEATRAGYTWAVAIARRAQGVPLDAEQRAALAAWARETGESTDAGTCRRAVDDMLSEALAASPDDE